MGKYLDQLRRDSQDTRVGSLTKLTEGASVGFVSAWGVGSPAEKTSGSAIQAAIVGARSWQDLSRLCEDIDAAYRADNIDAEAADELTNLVRQRFREVPENDAALLEMPLSQFAQSGICREVHSKILDEQVLRAADNAEVPADTPLAVYRASELRLLDGASPEMIRAVHQVKGVFDGEVVEDPPELSPDDQVIPSEALYARTSDTPPDTCPACRQGQWWTDRLSERHVCRVCHPPSISAVRRDRSRGMTMNEQGRRALTEAEVLGSAVRFGGLKLTQCPPRAPSRPGADGNETDFIRSKKPHRMSKGDQMEVKTLSTDTPPEEEGRDETVQLPGVIAALGELQPGAVVTEEGVARLFGRCPTSVKRAVARGELPPPTRIFGSSAWTVGVLVGHIENRLKEAAAEQGLQIGFQIPPVGLLGHAIHANGRIRPLALIRPS